MKTAICIASGPSLTQEDVDFCRNKADTVYVVNDCHRLAPWADVLYACDYKWWDFYEGAKSFNNQKWTIDEKAAAKYNLNLIGHSYDVPFSFDKSFIGLGGNSGFQALNLAVIQGHDRIILLGYDMKQAAGGKRHWFGEHPDQLMMNSNYSRWVEKFNSVSVAIRNSGVEVVNCSRDSALYCFNRLPLESVQW